MIKNKGDCNVLINLLCVVGVFLLVMDYELTYLGVKVLKVVSEMNPLMDYFLQIPFNIAFIIRLIVSVSIMIVVRSSYTKNTNNFVLMLFIVCAQLIMMLLHVTWLFAYCA